MSENLTFSWQVADQYFFDKLEPISQSMQEDPVYSLLKRGKESLLAEKSQFFDALDRGEEYAPNLTPDFDDAVVAQHEAALQALRTEVRSFIPTNEGEEAVKNAYHWKENELLASLKMARAARHGEMRAFNHYNAFIYGRPNQELFLEELGVIAEHSRALLKDPECHEVASNVLETILSIGATEEHEPIVDEELFRTLKETHVGYFVMALADIEVPEVVTPGLGMPMVAKIAHNLGAGEYKVVGVDSTTASVNHPLVEIRYPLEATYARSRFIGLYAGHELGTHIRERLSGAQSSFKLQKIGLDRNERASEGKGVLREQIAYESIDDFNAQERAKIVMFRHLSAALAVGVDGKPRNFQEVFKIMETFERMYQQMKPGNTPEQVITKARNSVWNLLVGRTLKGTSGTGNAYLKDMVYAEGNYAYWELAREHPGSIPYWDKGKSDLTNPRHIAVLQQLGVLPRFDK